MSYKLPEEQFEDYIQKLRQEFQENPKQALQEAQNSLRRLSAPKKKILKRENRKIFLIAIYFIIIALIGLINYTSMPLYLGGLVFFIGGLLIGLFIEKFGLIFLFSHGMTGLGLMLGIELSGLLTSPFISDAPIYIYISLGIILLLIILGLITTILYNLSDALKDNEYFIFIPLILFGIALLIAVIISKLVLVKFGIHSLIN
jgi:hypothetical protein